MPYVNRYFHERNRIIPFRSTYNVTPTTNNIHNGNDQVPRHITTYEYSYPKSTLPYTDHMDSQHFVNETNSTPPVKFDYNRRYYSSRNKSSEKESKMNFEAKLNLTQDMKAKIKSPSGKIQYCDIINTDGDHFNLRFTPTEKGEHVVSVKQDQEHVPGSPFKIVVGNTESQITDNVKASGIGLEYGYINTTNMFSVMVKDSGSGNLTVTIDGPSKAIIDLITKGKGSYQVEYQIPIIGEYSCSIKFNDEHISGSPFKIIIQNQKWEISPYSSVSSSHVQTLAAIQNQGMAVGRSISISLNQNGLNNNSLKAFMVTPSNIKEDIQINSFGNGQFNLRMKPSEIGLHKIFILFDEKPIPGCPFVVMCGEVVANGKGLVEATIDEITRFKIDTKHAEPGSIMVTIDGPSKIELICYEVDDGYELTYCPTIPGEHIISIKYQDKHLQGSPFKVNVKGSGSSQLDSIEESSRAYKNSSSPSQSYPENVRCQGEGIIKASLGRNNNFIVDASAGGAGLLYVGINGPSKPCEEINIRHIGGKRFQVNYFVQEYGTHFISIRWNETEIPQSPFSVQVP